MPENRRIIDLIEKQRAAEAKTFSVKKTVSRISELEKYAEFLKQENQSKDEISRIEMLVAEERAGLLGRVQAVADAVSYTHLRQMCLSIFSTGTIW